MEKIRLKKDQIELFKLIKKEKMSLDGLNRTELLEEMDLKLDILSRLNKSLDNYNENEKVDSTHYKHYLNCLEKEKYEELIRYEIVN